MRERKHPDELFELDAEIERELRGDDMTLTELDIPKSTLATGVILWGVLAGMGGWTLKMVSDMRADMSGQAQAIVAINARVDRLEKETDQNKADIRDLQRLRR